MSIGRMLETKAPDLDEMSSRENRRTVLPARHFFEPEDDCDARTEVDRACQHGAYAGLYRR